MRSIVLLFFCFVVQLGLLQASERSGFRVQKDVAQYKGSDYENVVQVARNISLEEAFDLAEKNPKIDYFVYTKARQMVLEIPPDVPFVRYQDRFGLVHSTRFKCDSGKIDEGYCRIFNRGDVVFFEKEGMWLGSAPGLADVYFKEQ